MRRFIIVLAAMASVVLLGTLGTGEGLLRENQGADAQSAERPNFVVVMTDDLDERSMEQLGGIRSIMDANGVTFENSFVTYALCCPSRASFFRGQYPHNHGITSDDATLGAPRFRQLGRDQSTIATWLDGAGYRTKYLGKYLNGYSGSYVPPGWDEWSGFVNCACDNVVYDGGQNVQACGQLDRCVRQQGQRLHPQELCHPRSVLRDGRNQGPAPPAGGRRSPPGQLLRCPAAQAPQLRRG